MPSLTAIASSETMARRASVGLGRPGVIKRVPPLGFIRAQAKGLRKEDSLEVKVRALLAERRQRIGYEREMVAALASCR